MNQFRNSNLGGLPYNNNGGYSAAPQSLLVYNNGGFTGPPIPNQLFDQSSVNNSGGYIGAPLPNQTSVDNNGGYIGVAIPHQTSFDNNGGYNAAPISNLSIDYNNGEYNNCGFQYQYQYYPPTMQRQVNYSNYNAASRVPAPVEYTMPPPPPPFIGHPEPSSEVTVKEEPRGSSMDFRENYSDVGGVGVNDTCPTAKEMLQINPAPAPAPARRWTAEEHKLFVIGMMKFKEGDKRDWRSISRYMVTTRSPTQVASHAQKYVLYNKRKLDDDHSSNAGRRKKESIHSMIVSDDERMPDKIEELKRIIVEQQRNFLRNLNKK